MRDKLLRLALPLVATPLLLLIGVVFFEEKRYAAISFFIVIAACCTLSLSLDKRTTHLRRTVLIAVMTALSVAGRFLFAALPAFKPVTAMLIITGAYLGRESGFLCGVLTAIVSNLYFGQGPWTPFQAFAFGLIGFAAGCLAVHLKKSRPLLLLFGAAAGVFYSLLMDVWTVLWYQNTFSPALYLAALATALPHTVLYAVSNMIFLFVLFPRIGRKLSRLLTRYQI